MAPRKGTVPHNKGKGKAAAQQASAAAAEAVQPQAALPQAGPEVSLTALQQLEEKRRRLCSQLKDVERQVGPCSRPHMLSICRAVRVPAAWQR